MNAVALDLKESIPVVEEDDHQAVLASHVDLVSEALVEGALGVIDQEEVAVGAEFGTPQHSFCLNPSKPHGEQGGYALGRSSRLEESGEREEALELCRQITRMEPNHALRKMTARMTLPAARRGVRYAYSTSG